MTDEQKLYRILEINHAFHMEYGSDFGYKGSDLYKANKAALLALRKKYWTLDGHVNELSMDRVRAEAEAGRIFFEDFDDVE